MVGNGGLAVILLVTGTVKVVDGMPEVMEAWVSGVVSSSAGVTVPVIAGYVVVVPVSVT
jgi:hypothetical protein